PVSIMATVDSPMRARVAKASWDKARLRRVSFNFATQAFIILSVRSIIIMRIRAAKRPKILKTGVDDFFENLKEFAKKIKSGKVDKILIIDDDGTTIGVVRPVKKNS